MAAIVYLAFIFAMLYGWVMNIVIIAGTEFAVITGMLVLRVVGIFVFPLGSVLGYL